MTYIIPEARAYLQERIQGFELEEMENCFDDLRSALDLANEFMKNASESHEDVMKFISETRKVERVFRRAISKLGKKEEMTGVEDSREAYEKALDGFIFDGKFVHHWKKIQSSKVRNIVSFQLFVSNCTKRRDLCLFIVHSTKLLNFDWWRAVQLIPNCTL